MSESKLESFHELYNKEHLRVFRWLNARLPTKEDAEELAQEIWIKIWTKWNNITDHQRGYLWVVVKNECTDWHRYCSDKHTCILSDLYDTYDGDADVVTMDIGWYDYGGVDLCQRNMEAAELLCFIEQVISTVTDRQAQAVRLRFLERLPYPEVGERMGCRAGAVKILVHRFRARLREQYEQQFDETIEGGSGRVRLGDW